MSKLLDKFKIYGRLKGRKKIKIYNYVFFNDSMINLNQDIKKNKKIILDVGSGSGENTILLATKNPDSLIIACEIFEDGNINLCNNLYKLKINNIKLFNNNVLILLENLKIDKCFDEIWILFPDPWPKKRHHKRRLINYDFFVKIYPLLKKQGKIFISTDSISYLNSILNSMYELGKKFKWNNDNPIGWTYKINELPNTKFFNKAKKMKRSSFFIELIKI